MLAQSMRASRQSLARAIRPTPMLRRTFVTPTAVRQADLVQDMYLKELKAYKPQPIKAGDADQHVHKFKVPAAPKSPEEANLQNDLKAYEDQVPEVEGQAAEGGAKPEEQDWFEEIDEMDEDEALKH